jgi:homoaconitase/3-isopropylmalate dehydratase large subunit
VKAGTVTFSSSCSFCLAQRLDVLNGSGQVVATQMIGLRGSLTANLPAGTYTFRVTSNAFATISYSIAYLK